MDVSVATRLAHAGSDPAANHGFVNPPVYHASTVTFPDVETMLSGRQQYTYGRRGTPLSDALEGALSELEGAAGTVLVPSGLAACSTALLSCLSAGDHLLVTDSVYQPTRHFCAGVLKRFGVETEFYDPAIGGEISTLIRPNTRAIYLESPGSQTMEIQDVPAIVAAARAAGVVTVMDNTWATPLFLKPIEMGVDLSVSAGTKYLVGHSDTMIGYVSASPAAFPALKKTHGDLGLCVGPDDGYLALRGLRTLGVRMKAHEASALKIARWLETQPGVARVLHPALAAHPGHALWQRDYAGSSGVFSFITAPAPFSAVKSLLDGLRLFALGYSWGGFESLAIVADPRSYRTATRWEADGHLIRLQIGLEEADDLVADLADGLAKFRSASAAAA